jgi:hypothetical protein
LIKIIFLGAVMVIDKEKKLLIRKYYIAKHSLTQIKLTDNDLVITGNSPIIYQWKINKNSIDADSVFDFLEKGKSNLIFLDSNITSISLFKNEVIINNNYLII